MFPGSLMAPTGKKHELMAVGIRQMTISKFRLYSIGFCLESDGIKALRSGSIRSVSEAVRLVLDRQFEWSLRIILLRNGSIGHLRDALVRRLKAADASTNPEHGPDISSFSSMFPNSPLVMNEQVLFHWSKPSGLIFCRDGREMGTHGSLWTSQQLLHIYTDPVTSTVPQVVIWSFIFLYPTRN